MAALSGYFPNLGVFVKVIHYPLFSLLLALKLSPVCFTKAFVVSKSPDPVLS
jgi:hypothetical protein